MKRKLTPTQRVAVDAVIPTSFWETHEIPTANQNRRYPPLAEAKVYVHSLGLKNIREWRTWFKANRPLDVPAAPNRRYATEWVSWSDWLGTGNAKNARRVYRPLTQARKFAHSLELSTREEWNVWRKSSERPMDIPTNPNRIYAEWVSLGDWLGTGNVAPGKRQFRSFNEAREFARSLGLSGREEWEVWPKSSDRPLDIPSSPRTVYKAEWVSWGDWLGTGTVATQKRQFRPFAEAREFVCSLGLSNKEEWCVWAKSSDRQLDIPLSPRVVYKAEWVSWGDWLRAGMPARNKRKYRAFAEAREFARSLGLKNFKEWQAWFKANRPLDLPSYPETVYEAEWVSWGDWLGTGNVQGWANQINRRKNQ